MRTRPVYLSSQWSSSIGCHARQVTYLAAYQIPIRPDLLAANVFSIVFIFWKIGSLGFLVSFCINHGRRVSDVLEELRLEMIECFDQAQSAMSLVQASASQRPELWPPKLLPLRISPIYRSRPVQFTDNRIRLTRFDQPAQRILIQASDSAEYGKRGFGVPYAPPSGHLYEWIERLCAK